MYRPGAMPSSRRAPPRRALSAHVLAIHRRIYAVVRRIPRGRVATYGQVALLAGFPGGARVAGAALKASTSAQRLPWQRVIGKRGRTGKISILDPIGAAVQRQLLEREGVEVSDAGAVSLARFGWEPTTRLKVKRVTRG